MWGRLGEMVVGVWLAASPFALGFGSMHTSLWIMHFFCAATVIVLALLSCRHRREKLHLINAGIALALVSGGLLWPVSATAPTSQNQVLTGLLLLLFALVPSRSKEPPTGWRRFYEQRSA